MDWQRTTFEAIGTRWEIDLPARLSVERRTIALDKVRQRIETFDQTYSRFRSDSLVTEMSKQTGEYVLPDDAKLLLDLYQNLYDLTDGAFTPLIGQTLVDAGYDASYSLQSKPLSFPPRWEEVMAYQHPKLTMKQPALLDVGAAGKGYLIDIVGGVLREQGIEHFCIDAGGDILYANPDGERLRIGLEDPDNVEQVIGVAQIKAGSICGSAGNRRAWGKYHHMIDPRTLQSPTALKAVWTTASSAMLADALTTCLFFHPPERFSAQYNFEYLMLSRDNSVQHSPGFPAELFTA